MREHILSLSYGKDSLACLGAIEDEGIVNAPQTPRAGRVSLPAKTKKTQHAQNLGQIGALERRYREQ